MNAEGDEVAVFVIAGSWECSDRGNWDFVLAKKCYGRSTALSLGLSYEELIANVTTDFELYGLNLKPKLSYWLPCQLSMFSVSRRPPVIITSTMGIRNFLNVRRVAVHLNLLLSLDNMSFDNS
ncbi:PREDICTED: uncharacterized protein LOC109126029 [Camelina sativa]|uniref:Uncharacterized protein LOC109126029 n=1 Tax=Camelina sativa TaxID=90675 RepID=A0ABM1QCY3_CAMSA|nr:PREDICTED: uncharacterized protein LOC109126029 [Camelina sativa]